LGGAEVRQLHSGNIGERPNGNLAVAVFADDEHVQAARLDMKILAQQVTKAGGVEDRARANPALGG